ncbi:MAG: tetratricopeptide repeat protein [Granulosicoccus sp.]
MSKSVRFEYPSQLMRRVLTGLLPVLLLGCSSMSINSSRALAQASNDAPEQSGAGQGDSVRLPDIADNQMDGQLMFELMIAELAGRRGQLDVALAGYLRASERTRDPRVSERATRLAMYGRQWAEAENAVRRWMSLDPVAEGADAILAQALLRQGKLNAAADQYVDIVDKSKDTVQAMRQIQVDLQQSESASQSLVIMQAILAAYPEEAEAHMGVARLQLSANDRQAALESVRGALEREPQNTDALLLNARVLSAMGRTDEGFSALQAAIGTSPENLGLRLGYAQMLVEAGRYDEVGEHLDFLYSAAPDNADTLLTISLLAIDSRRIERARGFLTKLLNTGEYQDQANFYLARISDQQKDYETAIAFYEAVQVGELQLNAQIRIAELQGITGNLEEGRERLRSIAATTPSPAMQLRLITAESRMLQQAGEAADAVNVLSDGLTQFPDNPDLLYARALAADGAGDQNLMMDDLLQLIELEPDNAHALNALGYHFASNNIELERADVLLVKANRLLPNDPAIIDSLGWLRYRQGQFDEAITLLRRAYSLYPDPEIAAHLGEVLWLNGEEKEARQLVERALIESPDDDNLQQVMQKYIE